MLALLAQTQPVWLPSGADLQAFAPELGLVGTIMALLIVPMIAGRGAHLTAAVALLGILGSMALATFVGRPLGSPAVTAFAASAGTPMLMTDSFALFFKIFLLIFLALIIWLWLLGLDARQLAGRSSRPAQSPPEFFVLLLTSALGMSLMVGTLNLLVIIIAMEMASLPSYAIVASDKGSRKGAEASLKYVLFGAAAAAIMVYGASLLYGAFGTLSLAEVARQVVSSGSMPLAAWFGLAGLCVGVAFKISAVPMHFWCPDVFEGAPIEITTWLSVASKAAGLGLLLRIVHVFASAGGGGAVPAMNTLAPLAVGIGVIASVTCTVGNLAALRQESVKRLLAYSSIAHAGYMMMAAAILAVPRDGANINPSVSALVSYLLVYLVMNLGAFGVTAMVVWQTGTDHISAFTGLGRRSPWLALPMAVCLFSLIGLPPLGGFTAKWWLLIALGKAAADQPWLWVLVVVAVVNTAISLYYYASIVRQMYLADDASQPAVRAPLGGLVMVNLCAVLLLAMGTALFNPIGQQARSFASGLVGNPTPMERQAS